MAWCDKEGSPPFRRPLPVIREDRLLLDRRAWLTWHSSGQSENRLAVHDKNPGPEHVAGAGIFTSR